MGIWTLNVFIGKTRRCQLIELLLSYFPLPFPLLSFHTFWILEDIDGIGKDFYFYLSILLINFETLNIYAEKYINNDTYKEST